MKQTIKMNRYKLIIVSIVLVFICLIPDAYGQEKIRSRFPEMMLKRTEADRIAAIPGFHHFVFQLTGSDKKGIFGIRRVYTLVVWAADKDNKFLDTDPNTITVIDPFKLEYTTNKIDKEISDTDEELKMSYYVMSKKQYDKLVTSTTRFLIFIPYNKTPDQKYSWQGYKTYEVYPVDKPEDINASDFNPKVKTEDNYLKPTPPARPEE